MISSYLSFPIHCQSKQLSESNSDLNPKSSLLRELSLKPLVNVAILKDIRLEHIAVAFSTLRGLNAETA